MSQEDLNDVSDSQNSRHFNMNSTVSLQMIWAALHVHV